MKSTIYIPKKINVGYQERRGTYTGKLAYVIYYDEKGVLRKENSWNSWRTKELGNDIHDNIPTEGFVLNKKAGDYYSGWGSHRQAYTRVYDPRGFEIEITIENLLFILEHCTSTKGKGLEGEFVYGWDGTKLLLLPVDSPDYKEITKYSDLLREDFKLGARTIKIGATYLHKDNSELTYLGKFDYYDYEYSDKVVLPNGESLPKYHKENKKRYFFCGVNREGEYYITTEKNSLNKFIAAIDEECHENYADMYEFLESQAFFSPPNYDLTEYIPYTWEEFEDIMIAFYENKTYDWARTFFDSSVRGILQRVEIKGGGTGKNVQPYLTVSTPVTEWFVPHWSHTKQKRTVDREYIVQFKSLRELFDLYEPQYEVLYLSNGKKWKDSKPKNYYT